MFMVPIELNEFITTECLKKKKYYPFTFGHTRGLTLVSTYMPTSINVSELADIHKLPAYICEH